MSDAWTPATRLTAAGFVATAVAFGPARMGYGLFLPSFRDEFSLSTSAAGLIASGGFFAFLLALLASAWVGGRFGERASVIAGALAASAGFAAVAAAETSRLLAVGIGLAGISAGLCWSPFNDAAERVVAEHARATALSVVSTGTSFGVVATAAVALAVAEGVLGWRGAWVGFAVGALALVAIAWAGVPSSGDRQPNGDATEDVDRPDPRSAAVAPARVSLTHRAAWPLYGAAFCFGMTNAIFLSFAADRVAGAGGLPGLPHQAAGVVIFLGYGVFGVLGLATGRIEGRVGLAPLLFAIFSAAATSLVVIGLAPTSWGAVIAASGLHGIAIMMVSAVFSFWSLRLFPRRGTLGFTVALLCMATGSVLGPALAGLLAEARGPVVMFLVAAVPPLVTALWFGGRLSWLRARSRASRV